MLLPPFSIVDPFSLGGFVNRNDFDEWSSWVAALDMERSAGSGKAEDQAAWTIFIIRVILDNFTSLDRLSDFIHAYAAQDGLVGGV
jgi:hypothetical protein